MSRLAMNLAAISLAACASSAPPAGTPAGSSAAPASRPEAPSGADVARISERGEDVPSLEDHVVRGKVTVFDFYADWCAPCRKVDNHVFALLGQRRDLALRKLNVVSWESPLALRHLKNVDELPYLIVYGKDGALVGRIIGFDLDALDRAIAEGAR